MPNWKKLITSGSSGSLANLNVDNSVTASSFSGIFAGALSSSAQIASDISGSIISTSSSIASDIATLVLFSSSLETTIYDYTGSFTGDGSGLTNINTQVTEIVTKSDTFTSANTHSVFHTFNTKDLNVTVYDENDDIFIPARINTPTTSSVTIYMEPAKTGRVVVSKGGHLISGSIYKEFLSGGTIFTVTHSLQQEFPIVQLYESESRKQFIPEEITSIDENHTQINLLTDIDCFVVIKG